MVQSLSPQEIFTTRMTDGVELAVRRYGIGNGPCLLMSHGNGFAIDGYRVFWEPLIGQFELALFDMRNHGRNAPSSADQHHYLQMSLDIGAMHAAMKERVQGRPLVGVFHSFSARAAMKHAVERGWMWDALVLFDPPNVPPRSHRLYETMRTFELKLVEWACNRPDAFAAPEDMVKSYRESRATGRWVPQAIEDMGRAILREHTAGSGWTLSCRRELEAAIYLQALTLDLWPSAAAFGGPTMLIGADPAVKGGPPTGMANQALAQEQGYEYAFVPETGHLLQVEKPAECREVMLAFLRKHGVLGKQGVT